MSFEKEGYELIENVISKEICELLSSQFKMQKDVFYYLGGSSNLLGDDQVENCFASYGNIWSECLLLHIKDIVEKITGKILYPTYSYARIYYKDSDLKKHVDRNSCEYSVSITLKVIGEDWPIYFLDRQNNTKKIIIPEGSILIYKGRDLLHWREKISDLTTSVYQVFLHYVDANGNYSNCKYDNRVMLGLPLNPIK
jgi:hypothetical protein